MTNLFIAYVAAFFLPLLFHSWRVAVLGLGVQGLLLALIMSAHHLEEAWDVPLYFEFTSLLLVRAVFVPWYLFRRMRSDQSAPLTQPSPPGGEGGVRGSEFTLVSKNLVQWTLAFLLLVIAFVFGDKISPHDPNEALQIGAAAGAILIGLLVLANQNHPLGQIIGLFTFEGGVTLVELLSPHAMPFPVMVGVSLVFVFLVLICGHFLGRLMTAQPASEVVEDKVVL